MYETIDFNQIKPQGWLYQQLKIQADGLCGNLDKIWPDIRDSAWIGGSREGWERVPYWLDGFIPLAWLLDNEDMKQRAKYYIRSILSRQQADGWICPCKKKDRFQYDVWALFLIGKVFVLYYNFTKDPLVQDSLYRAMKCFYKMLKAGKISLFNWGKFRWFEGLISLQFLYEHYNESWILDLAGILRAQGADYTKFTADWEKPLNQWRFETHIVNIAMMLKTEAVCGRFWGEKESGQSEKLWNQLKKYNGTAVGTFSGDECLAGQENNRGTELCSIAELMYSCELLYAATEKGIWGDRLEKIAFNALPAAFLDDMWAHQYDQMVNQIACIKFPGKSFFGTNSSDAHLFGLEPNFGCCTANFGQAWPKLALYAFLKIKNGILCAMMLPCKINTQINGVPVQITMETEYPFRHSCRYKINADAPVSFTLKIRIPGWVQSYTVNGEKKSKAPYFSIFQKWQGESEVIITLCSSPRITSRPIGLKAVEYGPLVFSLPIVPEYQKYEYTQNNVERKFPYCDYSLIPASPWQYGFGSLHFTVQECMGDEFPFSSKKPRLMLKASVHRILWEPAGGYDSVASATPHSKKPIAPKEYKMLWPYGCAKLRITELPVCTKQK